jgi:hypothetical protein
MALLLDQPPTGVPELLGRFVDEQMPIWKPVRA